MYYLQFDATSYGIELAYNLTLWVKLRFSADTTVGGGTAGKQAVQICWKVEYTVSL